MGSFLLHLPPQMDEVFIHRSSFRNIFSLSLQFC
jgi:hypothetical protein